MKKRLESDLAGGIKGNDRVEDLTDLGPNVIRNLDEMERRYLTSGKLSENPWSDDYWGTYAGGLGKRYQDRYFPNSENWKRNYDYIRRYPASSVQNTNILAPSEKYDRLIGDSNSMFTNANWNEGYAFYRQYSEVETWMGRCHGWAPASFMLPRPKSTITVKDAWNRDLTLYPSDIKALGTSLWADSLTNYKFIGGRCKDKNPQKDWAGRNLNQKCFDTNPGTWHMAVVNQIGIAKRSFIIDATYDYQVWNHPVIGYSYSYFNPANLRRSQSLQWSRARLPFNRDKFAAHRDPRARSVVGIVMQVTYVVETEPNARRDDSPYRDGLRTVTYMYDVELDGYDQIIGGEWYSNLHPDFLWLPPKNAKAQTTWVFEDFVDS